MSITPTTVTEPSTRVHHYGDGEVQTYDADPGRALAEYITIKEEEHIFLVSDEGQELEVATIIRDIGISRILPVIVHPRKTIEITVSYAGRQVEFGASPGARVGAVRDKAIKLLGIDPADAADLGLRTLDGVEDLPVHEPIGKVAGKHHKLSLQLVAMQHPQG